MAIYTIWLVEIAAEEVNQNADPAPISFSILLFAPYKIFAIIFWFSLLWS